MNRRVRALLFLGTAASGWVALAARHNAERSRREDALWAAASEALSAGATERRSVRP